MITVKETNCKTWKSPRLDVHVCAKRGQNHARACTTPTKSSAEMYNAITFVRGRGLRVQKVARPCLRDQGDRV